MKRKQTKKSKTTGRKPARRTQPIPRLSLSWEDRYRQIAWRAYELYEQRSRLGPLDDWLQAEREILKKKGPKSKTR